MNFILQNKYINISWVTLIYAKNINLFIYFLFSSSIMNILTLSKLQVCTFKNPLILDSC